MANVSLVYRKKKSRFWWIVGQTLNGVKQSDYSSKTTIREQAEELAVHNRKKNFDEKRLGVKHAVEWTLKRLIDWVWDKYWSKAPKANRDQLDSSLKAPLEYFGAEGEPGNRVAKGISDEEALDYQSDRTGEVSKSSVNKEMTLLRSAFNKAIKAKLLFENPFASVSNFDESNCQRDRSASEEERLALIEKSLIYPSRQDSPGLLRDVLEFDFAQGLRAGEIRALKWTDIDFQRRKARVGSFKRKGKTLRWVDLMDAAIVVLERRPRIGEYVFCNAVGGPIPRHGLLSMGSTFGDLVRHLGIKNFRFHDIRHTFATAYYWKTFDLAGLKNLLGHTKIETTIRYINLDPTDVRPRGLSTDIYAKFTTVKIVDSEETVKNGDNQAARLAQLARVLP